MLKITADLSHELEFAEESVEVATGAFTVTSHGRKVLSVPTSDIASAFVEEGLSVAKLVVKTKSNGEIEAAYFTKKKVRSFRKFADAVNRRLYERRRVNKVFDEREGELKSSMSTIYWLYGFTSRHRRLIYAGLALSLVSVAFSLVPPYLMKVLIDSVILAPQHPETLFIELTITLVIAYASSNAVGAYQNYVLTKAGNGIITDLMDKMFDRALRLSPDTIDRISTSRIQSRLTSDAGNTQWMLTYGLITAVTNGLTVLGIGVMLFVLFPALAVYVLIPVPFITLLAYIYGKKSKPLYHKRWRKNSDMYTRIYNTMPNYLIVKTAAKEENEHRAFNDTVGANFDTQLNLTKMNLKYWTPFGLLISLAAVVIWWVGGNQVILGITQLGVITAFLAYMGMFYSPIAQLSSIIPYIQQSITSGERIRELFNPEYDPKLVRNGKKPDIGKEITFRNVTFGYDPLLPVLKDVSTTMPSGKRTAIVGKSGSGKTTMAKLMLGLYSPDDGDILFGRESMERIDTTYLRRRIAYVPQDPIYFDGSISYNISYYAHGDVRPVDLIASVKAVEVHDEVMKLPLKYDNRIRGRGVNLSGGQRQRLSIARAILNDSDMILLDEITASLDAINARRVHKAVLNIEEGKTLVIIAHDINEIMSSDHVILLEDGRVAEQGSPRELLRKKGKLFRMFKYRFGSDFIYRPPKKGRSIASFVEGMLCDERKVATTPASRAGLVNAEYGGRHMKELSPRLPFPISHPEFVILANRKGRELLALQDYRKLDRQSVQALQRCLAVNRLDVDVLSIREIRQTGDGMSWRLRTNKGEMRVLTRNWEDVMDNNGTVILIDEFGTPLKIDTNKLDRKSLDILERSI